MAAKVCSTLTRSQKKRRKYKGAHIKVACLDFKWSKCGHLLKEKKGDTKILRCISLSFAHSAPLSFPLW